MESEDNIWTTDELIRRIMKDPDKLIIAIKQDAKERFPEGDFLNTLDKIETIKPMRNRESQADLLMAVMALCISTPDYGEPKFPDSVASLKKKFNQLQKEIPKQERAVGEIEAFLRDYSKDVDRPLNPGHWAGVEKFKNTLSNFRERLTSLRIIAVLETDRYRNILGPLQFKEPLSRQAQRETPQLNDLIFAATILFRAYTNPNFLDENWLSLAFAENPTPMPTYGKPFYPITASLAQAAFPEFELDRGAVKQRVWYLKRKGASLRKWL